MRLLNGLTLGYFITMVNAVSDRLSTSNLPGNSLPGAAGSRIYVQEGIYDKFVARFKERIKKNVVGDPFDDQTFQGPQVSQMQFDRIMRCVESS